MNKHFGMDLSGSKDIYAILGHMQVVLDFCHANTRYAHILPFLYTYYTITKTVALKRVDNSKTFTDPVKMEQLDVGFADLFFTPLSLFLNNKPVPSPWHTYFQYCKRPSGPPFLQMLLGINAHINGDLAPALLQSQYAVRADFLAINKILLDEIPAVLKYLILKQDALALAAYTLPAATEKAFREIIVGWREDAWKNAKILRQAQNPARLLHSIRIKTEQMASVLISLLDEKIWPEKLLSSLPALEKHRVLLTKNI